MSPGTEHSPELDPTGLLRVETMDEIRKVGADVEALFVYRLTDAKLAAVAHHAPRLRRLIADGNTRVTDDGLHALRNLNRLESLDLEWSDVTDAAVSLIAAVPNLRWVDLGFCKGVSRSGIAELKRLRPDLEVIDTAV